MIKNVLEYLEQSAAKSPDKTAVADEHNAFTYQELLDNAQRVGAVLQRETQVRTAVPVYMEKSCNALAAFMGAAKAGCFYCLLDPAQPVERIQMILATLGAEIMIIDEKSAKKQDNSHADSRKDRHTHQWQFPSQNQKLVRFAALLPQKQNLHSHQ